MNKNDKLLPVPLEYTYPFVMKIKLSNFKNNFVYIPEINKFVSETGLNKKLRSLGIYPDYWKVRWIERISSNQLSGDNWINFILNRFYKDKPKYTKLYISFKLRRNPLYVCDFYCLSDDIVNLYYKTRLINDKEIYNYDFSQIQKFIKYAEEKFIVDVKEINPTTNNFIGNWITDFHHFIYSKYDNVVLGRVKTNKYLDSIKFTKEQFIKSAIELFGDKYDYSNIIYTSYTEKVYNIYCNECNKVFDIYPRNFIYLKRGCPHCGRKRGYILESLGKKDFVNKCINLFGDEMFDYTESNYINYSTPIKIKDLRTGDYFYQTPANHLSRGRRYQLEKDSSGERLIRLWINNNLKDFSTLIRQKVKLSIYNIDRSFYPDFQIQYNNVKIWIEYNGIQHYEFNSKLHHNDIKQFEKQLIRDILLREYCKENDIILIEIPYTYNTYKKIEQLLNRVILNGENINSIIDYSKLYKI